MPYIIDTQYDAFFLILCTYSRTAHGYVLDKGHLDAEEGEKLVVLKCDTLAASSPNRGFFVIFVLRLETLFPEPPRLNRLVCF